MDIHRSALRHGATEHDILHAVENALAVVDLEPDADPPKTLAIGPTWPATSSSSSCSNSPTTICW